MDLAFVKVKCCQKCKEVKDKTEFAKQARSSDGLQSWCKPCRKKYRLENREYLLEQDRKRYRDNPESFKLASKRQRAKLGKEKIKEYNQSYAKANKQKIAETAKKWRQRNQEKLRKYNKARYLRDKDKYYERNRKKWEESPHLVLEACRRRTALKAQSVPKWANKKKIVEVYLLASKLTQLTGEKYQVDHIVPINSKIVCGLHVENNLQIITASENSAKGNRWWPEKP